MTNHNHCNDSVIKSRKARVSFERYSYRPHSATIYYLRSTVTAIVCQGSFDHRSRFLLQLSSPLFQALQKYTFFLTISIQGIELGFTTVMFNEYPLIGYGFKIIDLPKLK